MPMLDIQRRHAEVFRLRFGEKGSKGEPRKLTDSIRVTSPSRAVVQAFVDVWPGNEVKAWNGGEGAQFEAYLPTTEIPIMILPGQSLTQWWESWRRKSGGDSSVCERRCDGETETLSGQPCVCPADITERLQDPNACRPMTRVAVLCPDVEVVGAGSFVSHGMIAAETLPQAIAVAEAALARGLMVPAMLRVVEHRGKRHYIVPQIEIVGASLRQLATGEVTGAIQAGGQAELAPPAPAALEAPKPVATAKKSTRATKATKKASAPPATASTATRPPLPGEGEPTTPPPSSPLADEKTRKELADRIAALDADLREAVKQGWDSYVGVSFKAAERFTMADAGRALNLIVDTERDIYLRRQKRANACMGEVDVTSDEGRHALVKEATGGETESTGRLTESQLSRVVDYCEALKCQDEGVA